MPGAFFRAILLTEGRPTRLDGQPAKPTLLEAHQAEIRTKTAIEEGNKDWTRRTAPITPEGGPSREKR